MPEERGNERKSHGRRGRTLKVRFLTLSNDILFVYYLLANLIYLGLLIVATPEMFAINISTVTFDSN